MISILFGPIASGKSTFAAAAAGRGAVIINDDAIVNAVHAGQYSQYQEGLKPLYKAVELVLITHAVALGRDVVIDRPNRKRATRDRYRLLAETLDTESVLVVFRDGRFDGDQDGERRFVADSRGLTSGAWRSIAKSHAKTVDELTTEERVQYTSVDRVPWDPELYRDANAAALKRRDDALRGQLDPESWPDCKRLAKEGIMGCIQK